MECARRYNRVKAARALGISRTTLYDHLAMLAATYIQVVRLPDNIVDIASRRPR
jgi:hypothetical protein